MGETNMARKRLTRAESKARTRAYLLEAAAALFRRHGFEGTSVEQIAEEAGYTKGALYTHFASKEDLFAALLESTVRTQIEDLRDRIAAEERPEARYDLLRRMSARWGGDQDAAMLDAELRLAAARNPALGVKLAPLADQLYATLAGLIARVAGDAGVRRRAWRCSARSPRCPWPTTWPSPPSRSYSRCPPNKGTVAAADRPPEPP